MPANQLVDDLDLDEYQYGFVDEETHVFRTRPGLDADIVRQISKHKDEPEWMLEFRLKALRIYESKPYGRHHGRPRVRRLVSVSRHGGSLP